MERKNDEAAAARYLYAVSSHEDELDLCGMEMRALFGCDPEAGCILTGRDIDPSRSPFIRAKLSVLAEADAPDGLAVRLAENAPGRHAERPSILADTRGRTFKVVFVETDGSIPYEEQRAIEREIGGRIRGKAEMRKPELSYGIAYVGGIWLFGIYERSRAAWLDHNVKPRPYSTALGTRVARAVANIAAPLTEGVRVIDPCCGIGTVIIEALSMGINIEGCDINPLAVKGARVNLAHFGMPDVVKLADMRTIGGEYDAAILDLPYNLCSVLPEAERLAMLESVRRLAPRVVIVTAEPVEAALAQAGLAAADRCIVRKGRFERHILLCDREDTCGMRLDSRTN